MTESGAASQNWRDVFVGRDDELRTLTSAWQTARTRTPAAAAIIADPGFGKTRLAHEFYGWLSRHEDPEPGYWPPSLAVNGANLGVNPPREACGQQDGAAMPFLWWGLRLLDPSMRNTLPASTLSTGVQVLRPHLGQLQQALRSAERRRTLVSGGIDFGGDVGMEVAAHGATMVADVALPGFGLLRTLYKQLQSYRDVKLEERREALLNISPLFEGQRQQADLIATIVEDLRRVVVAPPGDLEPIPAVLFVDDAHHAQSDPSLLPFLDALLHAARSESWPLLVLVSCWEHSWESAAAGPSVRAILTSHFGAALRELRLGQTSDLGPVVDAALPGLASTQRAMLLATAEGNPEYLCSLLELFLESPRWFVDRRLDRELNEEGATRLRSASFADVMRERLHASEPRVRQILSVAAGVGRRFAVKLVARAGELLDVADPAEGLATAVRAPGFIALGAETGEFRQNAYLAAAREDAPNYFDESHLSEALARAAGELDVPVSADADDEELLSEQYNLLCNSPLTSDRQRAYAAVGRLVKLRMDLSDFRGAVGLARIWLEAFQAQRFALDADDRAEIDAIATCLEHWGQRRDALDLRMRMLDAARTIHAADSSDEHLADLRLELYNVAQAVEELEGPAAAEVYWREALSAAMSLYDHDASSRNQTALALSLLDIARNRLEAGDLEAARPALELSIDIQKGLLEDEPEGEHELVLAQTQTRFGQALLQAGDEAAAARAFEEAIARIRAVDDEVPNKQLALAATLLAIGRQHAELGCFVAADPLYQEAGQILKQADSGQAAWDVRMLRACFGMLYGSQVVAKRAGDAAAITYYRDSLAQARDLADHLKTPNTLQMVNVLLTLCALSLRGTDQEPEAVDHAREAVTVSRELASAEQTPSSRRMLAHSLGLLGELLTRTPNPGAGTPPLQEHVALLRELHAEGQADAESLRRGLIGLGNHLRGLRDRRAAVEVYEEGLALAHSMSEQEPLASNLREELLLTERLKQLASRRFRLGAWWRHQRAALALRHSLAASLLEHGMSLGEIRRAIRSGENLPGGGESG